MRALLQEIGSRKRLWIISLRGLEICHWRHNSGRRSTRNTGDATPLGRACIRGRNDLAKSRRNVISTAVGHLRMPVESKACQRICFMAVFVDLYDTVTESLPSLESAAAGSHLFSTRTLLAPLGPRPRARWASIRGVNSALTALYLAVSSKRMGSFGGGPMGLWIGCIVRSITAEKPLDFLQL